MASKTSATAALFLSFNLLFFTLVTACGTCNNPTPTPTKPKPTPSPKPLPNPSPKPPSCPRDALKLGVCANLLSGLINVVVGTPKTPCCTLIQGLADLEAAVCLCTAIRANILGINLNVPVSLSLLLNACGKKVPSGYQCA